MRVVIALGGNALASGNEGSEAQRARIADAASAIADIARTHEVVITHGNGPQIGQRAVQLSEGGTSQTLDVLGAETEGMLGYWIESELAGILPTSELATLITQVEVSADDAALQQPTKPIGPLVSAERADALRESFGYSMARFEGGFRRVVGSPKPLIIREARAIRLLLDAGVLVICAGGGGIPVARSEDGGLVGVEAVIDKDRTAALLAVSVEADRLLLLTNVAGVYFDWPARQQLIRRSDPATLSRSRFEAGTMGPKVEAACAFAARTGKVACIGALSDARRVFAGDSGTWISNDAQFTPERAEPAAA